MKNSVNINQLNQFTRTPLRPTAHSLLSFKAISICLFIFVVCDTLAFNRKTVDYKNKVHVILTKL